MCAPLDLGEGGRTLWEELAEGAVCVAWEEWSGRLVVVPSGFRQELRLVNFAAGPMEVAVFFVHRGWLLHLVEG